MGDASAQTIQPTKINTQDLIQPKIQRTCRICLSLDSQTNLISPCICSGSIKYVHEKCLLQWLNIAHEEQQRSSRKSCQICKCLYQYEIELKKHCVSKEQIKTRAKQNWVSITIFLIIIMISVGILSVVSYYTFNGKIKLGDSDPGFVVFILATLFLLGVIAAMILNILQKCVIKNIFIVNKIKSRQNKYDDILIRHHITDTNP